MREETEMAAEIKARAEVYFDASDPMNVGWAYRVDGGPSGAIDNLRDLMQVILDYGVSDKQMADLPTFGGGVPESTVEVWSWDTTSLLVGSGDELEIVAREEV